MNKRTCYFKKFTTAILFLFSIAAISLPGCKSGGDEGESAEVKKDSAIEIVTNLMDFNMVDTIPSGWNTFRYVNNSEETHFYSIDKYPEGKTIEDGKRELDPVFQGGMDLINQGKPEEGMAEFAKLPEWTSKITYVGGGGMVSPGHSSETTIKLDPGYYIIECYMKMNNGVFHSTMGMTKALIVKDSASGHSPLTADVPITISSTDGIVFPDSIKAGKNIFSVYFKDQKVYENFVGHDVNLVRLGENADLKVFDKWMDWRDAKGLINPTPEGFTFIGGANGMPAGNTEYFVADLDPGTYAFIAEVPDAMSKGLLKTFIVSGGTND